jgi:hypothetical protein
MRRLLALGGLAALLALAAPSGAAAQGDGSRPQDAAVRVFVDCGFCDFDHLRREVGFVDYMRDFRDAQIHILVTRQSTAAGGRRHVLEFIGREAMVGRSDTLYFVSRQDDAGDIIRNGLAHTIKLGLVPYLTAAGQGDRLRIAVADAGRERRGEAARPAADPWNLWVFRVRANASFNGEQRRRLQNLDGSFTAGRTTEDWKLRFFVNGRQNSSRIDTGTRIASAATHYVGGNARLVRSVTDHLSMGGQLASHTSTFGNVGLQRRIAPAMEYSFFPYNESTRRQVTVLYTLGAVDVRYEEETIFNKIHEQLFNESLEVAVDFRQPWGSASTSIEGSHYFHDMTKFRLDLRTSGDLRVVKGLSLNFSARTSLIRDQLHLPKKGATEEEILLRQRSLGTSYDYGASLGFAYTFGSIFNNVVNTRMDS